MTLPDPSEEQQAICDALSSGNNVIVDAVAGAGKTTTVLLSMNDVDSHCKSLLLTYNMELKNTTREAAIEHEIFNLEVHSYNSFGVQYISDECCTDSGFLTDYKISDTIPQYKRVYIDEIQDCTYMYYKLICKLLATQTNIQICVLGDPAQTIFAFKGANSKYLTLADNVFPSAKPWVRLTLQTSYRLTIPIANFFNKCVIHEDKFKSIKPGPPVKMLIIHPKSIGIIVKQLLSEPGVTPGDIFILNYSVKPSKTMAAIEKSLKNIPRIVLNDDSGRVDKTIVAGKLVIASFHKVKGLGRKKVIVMGFDRGYYYSDRDADRTKCSNPQYVGLSRPAEELILIHAPYNESFEWFTPNEVDTDTLVITGIKKPKPPHVMPPDYKSSVRDFIKFISSTNEIELRKLISCKTIVEPTYIYNIPAVVDGLPLPNGVTLVEEVAEITGLAIPAYAQYKLHKVMQIYADLHNEGQMFGPIDHYANANKLLRLTVHYWTLKNKFKYRKEQLMSYDWISQTDLESITDRMIQIVGNEVVFEREGFANLSEFGTQMILHGYADCITNDAIYEIKCTKELMFEHQLQVLMYAWLFNRDDIRAGNPTRSFRLLNALSGEVQEVTCSDFPKLMEILVKNKIRVDDLKIDDETFIAMHNK